MGATPNTVEVLDTNELVTLAREIVRLDILRKAAQQVADDAETQRKVKEARLLELFAEEGVNQIRVDGVLAYLHREVWPKAKTQLADGSPNTAAITKGLKKGHFGWLVKETYNSRQLQSFFKEREANGIKPLIPRSLADVVELSERFSIRSKKG